MAARASSSSSVSPIAIAGAAAAGVALIGAAAYMARQRRLKREEKEAKEAKIAAATGIPASVGMVAAKGPRAKIVSVASAFPPNSYAQSVYQAAFLRNHAGLTPEDESFVQRVFTGTGFDTCSSYLPEDQLFTKFTRTKYVKYIKDSLRDLAMRSSTQALKEWGGDRSTITHIVFGTMTGSIHAPTMDIEIAIAQKLSPGVKRLNVEGMGCLTGYRCLGLASDIARSDPRNIVLLIVCDIRSALGNQLPPYKQQVADKQFKSNVIVSSLFRDSGASAIITSDALGKKVATAENKNTLPLYEIVEHKSALIPNTFDLVKYHEKDDAVIFLDISKDLPEKIKEVLKPQVEQLLAPHGLEIKDCTYAVHTGGPKVLNYVAESLGVGKGRMASSWYCMKKWGNLSGSSNLVVLDHWRKLPERVGADIVPESRKNVVCMSFGPGVGMELLLLRVTSPEVKAADF